MCRCLRIQPSGFYTWLKTPLSRRAREDARQTELLRKAWTDILALHTGQRQGDLLRAAWSNYDGRAIRIFQQKRKTWVTVPCTKAMVDRMPRVATVVLTSTTGKAWKKRDFAAQWKEAGDLAGLTDLHFHDLRGTAVTMLAEAGCTIPEIAAITDHSLKTVNTILEKYLSRTRALAESAMETLEDAPATDFANRGQSEAAKTG